jgi:CheY-like chemotaxis protein
MLLELTVQDTGIGMTEEVLGRVFEPFFQSGNGFTRLYGGTGLGLAISRHLAELMGGALTAESSVGVGSTFRLVLPFVVVSQTTAPSAPAARSPAEMWDGPTLRILFAEDNRTNTFFGVSLLTLMGHQVTAVENGREALAAMERGTFDLVLMDVQMPVMNGDEALAVIRERIPESGRPIPVIAVTAYAMKGEEERLLAAGFDGYVAKPLELRKLTDAMKRAISSCVPCG